MNVGYNVPTGWEERTGNGKVKRDWETYYSAPASLSVDCTGTKVGFCSASQTIHAIAGLRITVGGVLKTQGTAKVSVQVECLDGTQRRFASRRVMFAAGTTDWVGGGQQVTLPAGTEFFRITLHVNGIGKAWLDDVSLSAEGANVVIVRPTPGRPWQPTDPSLRPVTATPGWYENEPEWWNDEHQALLALTAKNQGPCDIVWFGDSIGRGWGGRPGEDFIPEWRALFGGYKTLNYSIGGDATQNVLWRMLHGEGEGVNPRLVVIAIGTNNLWDGGVPPDAIAAGVRRCTKVARRQFPGAKVLVVAPLPIAREPNSPNRLKLDVVRANILHIFRLNPHPDVRVLNCSRKFLEADHTISPAIMPDFVHPSVLGYARYAECLQPAISKLLSN
jgi:lysophospholipase L1-like esterase